MKIKTSYDNRDDLPKGFEELYDEKDGKFVLTGVEGLKTQADVDTVRTSLVAERADHKKTKDKLKVFGNLTPEEIAGRMSILDELQAKFGDDLTPEMVQQKLDSIDELEAQVAAGKGKPDEGAIERIVETRVKRALAPVERERDNLKKLNADLTTERDGLTSERRTNKVNDAVRKAAVDIKVIPGAIDDVLLNAGQVFEIDDAGKVVTREAEGLTPGLDPAAWLKDMQDRRAHWWPTSQGGGAGGSGNHKGNAGNPWAAQNWNMTEQGNYLREHGVEKASQLAAQAGTKVGGPRPVQQK